MHFTGLSNHKNQENPYIFRDWFMYHTDMTNKTGASLCQIMCLLFRNGCKRKLRARIIKSI